MKADFGSWHLTPTCELLITVFPQTDPLINYLRKLFKINLLSCHFYPIPILLLKFSQGWDDNREIAPSFGRMEREEQHFLQSLPKEVLLSKIFQLEFAQVYQSSHNCSLKSSVRASGWWESVFALPGWDGTVQLQPGEGPEEELNTVQHHCRSCCQSGHTEKPKKKLQTKGPRISQDW